MTGRELHRPGGLLLIGSCFLLSGFAALLYETIWLRQFAIILGTSEQALAVILASYMAGLSLGSWLAAKMVGRVRHPVWLYGVLEAGIAVCAIAMPWGLQFLAWLQIQLFGGAAEPPAAGSWSQIGFGLVSCLALIVLPTAMMGATLPLLAKQVVHRNAEVGPRVGLLYGINTFGAVAGTLAAAFLFLPRLGLQRTTLVGAAINLAIFVLVALLARRGASPLADAGSSPDEGSQAEHAAESDSSRYRMVLWFAAGAGAVAFCYEIIFTRMLSHLLGGSVYAFATMLAGFLLGIALGGTLAARLAIRRDRSVVLLVYAQCLAGLSGLLAYHLVDQVAGWSFGDWGGTSTTFTQVTVSILILLPTATWIGATFPLATRIYAKDPTEAASGAARVYFWNTLGGIGGALLTGMFLLPQQAYPGAAWCAVLANAVLASGLVLVLRTHWLHLAAGLSTLVLLIWFAPGVPDRLLRVSALDGRPTEGELIFSQVGRSGTVCLFDQQGDFRFMTNGLPESIVARKGSRDAYAREGAWLSALPPLLRSKCDSMLIVGLGGGVAAAYVPPSVAEIDIFELEPAVVEANEFIRHQRTPDPLADSRLKIILNDGRNGLALTSRTYDAIVSQPSHPWTAGASHLYTREFAALAREHLRHGGIFLQWMNTSFITPELFRSLAATLLDVFPHVRVYEPYSGNLLLVASDEPIRPEGVSQPKLDVDPRNEDFFKEFGISTPTHLLAFLAIDQPQLENLAQGAELITDEYNLLAMRAADVLTQDTTEAMKQFLADHAAYRQPAAAIAEACPTVNGAVLGLRLFELGLDLDPAVVRALTGSDIETRLYEATVARRNGQLERWAQLLRELDASHGADDPRSALLLLAHSTLGTYKSLGADEAKQLALHLDNRHRELFTAIEAISRNDLAAVQQRDAELSAFQIDEAGYELAVRLRILWRIADTGPDRAQRGHQALELIDESVPFLGINALVTFRVMAAIQADQPVVALACAVDYAKWVVQQIKREEVKSVTQLELMRSNLIRCHTMLSTSRLSDAVPLARYRDVMQYLEKVIAGDA